MLSSTSLLSLVSVVLLVQGHFPEDVDDFLLFFLRFSGLYELSVFDKPSLGVGIADAGTSSPL